MKEFWRTDSPINAVILCTKYYLLITVSVPNNPLLRISLKAVEYIQ